MYSKLEDNNEFRYVILRNAVIVSRIEFSIKRNGILTSCIEKILEYKDEIGFNKIIIQSVSTEVMYQWCLKNGYIEVGNGFGGELRGDFIKEV